METASRRLWRAAKTGPGTTQSPPAGWSHAHPVEPARLPGAISQNGAREARVRSAALRAPLHPARRSAIIEIATGGSGGMSFRKSRIVVPSKHNQSTALRAFTQNYGHPPENLRFCDYTIANHALRKRDETRLPLSGFVRTPIKYAISTRSPGVAICDVTDADLGTGSVPSYARRTGVSSRNGLCQCLGTGDVGFKVFAKF